MTLLFAAIMLLMNVVSFGQCEFTVTENQSYSEDFDGTPLDCWTVESIHGGHWATMSSGSTTVMCYSADADSIGCEARLISPMLDLSGIAAAVLNFQYAMMGLYQADELNVCYRSSATDAWHTLETQSFSDWQNTFEAVITLPNLSATYQICFYARSLGGYYIFVDDVMVASTASACLRPTELALAENNPNDVLISWEAHNGETSWTLDVDGNEREINANPYRLTGLYPQTLYTIQIKANCSADNSSDWSQPLTFTTACDVITVTDENPYTDDFEASDDFVCWTSEIISGIDNWVVDPGYYIPNHTAFFIWLGDEARLVSAPLDITAVTEPTLVFKHKQLQGELDVDELSVWYRTAATEAWQQLANFPFPTDGFETVRYALPNPSATYQISFKAKANNAEGVYVDDVAVGAASVVTSIEESAATSALYPNPTTGKVTIESTAARADIAVFDLFGKQLMAAELTGGRTELDLSGFAPGIYLVRLTDATGTSTLKVVKE